TYYAVLKLGATVVTISALSKRREITYYLKDSDAKALICYGGRGDWSLGRDGADAVAEVDHCQHLWIIPDTDEDAPMEGADAFGNLMVGQADSFESAPTEPNHTATILYTSGTTGQPKGAELTHNNIVMNVMTVGILFPERNTEIQLVALPLFHVYAQTCLMHMGLYAGDTLVLMQRFEPGEAMRLMAATGVTRFAGVPTMYQAFLEHPDFDDQYAKRLAETVGIVSTGGAPMPQAVAEAFTARTGISVMEGYGCTETSPVVLVTPSDEDDREGSVGKAIWGIEARVVDSDGAALTAGEVGELTVRGHCVMKGYYKRPEATAEAIRNGWYHTGDLATMDADGYVTIVGRTKELIIRGGFNVYPAEVEDVLSNHPKVAIAAVIGISHERYGEEIKAFIVPHGDTALEADEIIAWARDNMASHKYPRIVEIRQDLPLTDTGKVLKRDLA
ncbi:MAG: AMP-binding protein, partial [Pseudomonadota bacterium]|nr:AMP-binding protein [Pseudomonadota bacterium]